MIHIFISGKFFELPVRLIEDRTDLQITIMENGKNYISKILFMDVT